MYQKTCSVNLCFYAWRFSLSVPWIQHLREQTFLVYTFADLLENLFVRRTRKILAFTKTTNQDLLSFLLLSRCSILDTWGKNAKRWMRIIQRISFAQVASCTTCIYYSISTFRKGGAKPAFRKGGTKPTFRKGGTKPTFRKGGAK
jgi:hypothetical protein